MPAFLPSELPVRARTRHHWIVLLRPPNRYLLLAVALLLVTAVFKPMPMALVFGVVVAALAFLRWQTWTSEWVILTGRRIIRLEGVPETTSSESSLRVDRISGARLVQTVPGKLLGYGTIELEAPGDHPEVRRLHRIADARAFYLQLRRVVFGDDTAPDPDDETIARGAVSRAGHRAADGDVPADRYLAEHVTEPLPVLQPRPRGRRPRG